MIVRQILKRMSILFLSLFFTLVVVAAVTPNKPIETVTMTAQNTMVLEGEFTAVSVNTWFNAIIGKRVMVPQDQNIYLIINSGGGQYDQAVVLRKLIAQLPNVVVICKYCGSAAGYIQATSLHRLVVANSRMIMHEMFWQHATAKLVHNTRAIEGLQRSSDEFDEAIYSVIGMSKADYEKKITDTEWSVDSEEMVKLHLAQKIVKLDCDVYISYLAPHTCSGTDE